MSRAKSMQYVLIQILILSFFISISASCQMAEENIGDVDEDQLQEVLSRQAALEISDDERPSMDTQVLITSLMPSQDRIPAIAKKSDFWCTTDDVPRPDPASTNASVPEETPYLPLSENDVAESDLPSAPSNLRGGPFPNFPPDPAIGPLLQDYRAQNCDTPPNDNERRCRAHPYRRALENEYADPDATFERARAFYNAQ